jgi:hypothetical protein
MRVYLFRASLREKQKEEKEGLRGVRPCVISMQIVYESSAPSFV